MEALLYALNMGNYNAIRVCSLDGRKTLLVQKVSHPDVEFRFSLLDLSALYEGRTLWTLRFSSEEVQGAMGDLSEWKLRHV